MYRLFRNWWYSLLKPSQPTSPHQTGTGTPHVSIALYQSQALTDRNGRAPEQTVARFMGEALDRARIASTIRFGYAPIRPPTNDPHADGNYEWWVEADKSFDAPDANLLILDTAGGGASLFSGRYSLCPGQHINRLIPLTERGKQLIHQNIRANLHELGHLFSGKHTDPILDPPSMWFHDNVVDDFHDYLTTERQPG